MSEDGPIDDRSVPTRLPDVLAITLVAGSSAAVLVFEILAGRLLAPYVGVNLETYTAIIGTILAGIALGAWAGGVLADRMDPRALIPVLLVAGGALGVASIPVVRLLGGSPGPGAQGLPSLLLALVGFGPSAAVLSAVPPAVIKLQLRDLDRTGATVGSLSAWGTAGAIGGTFLAGFVLVAYAAVTTLIVGVGLLLVLSGLAMGLPPRATAAPRHLLSAGGLAVVALAGTAATGTPCDAQSSYYCISVERDPENPSGRVLVLDDLRHSYVDLEDPTVLDFWYVRRITEAIDTLAPPGPLDVVYLGAGGMTIPRWLRETRPSSEQVVLELDADLVELIDEELPFPDGPVAELDGLDVVTGDGRLGLRRSPDDSADVIVGDAFGSRAVPWHLATVEFTEEVARVLRPGGIYVVNIIDGPLEEFLRAETATVREVLPHVAVMRGPNLRFGRAGNAVLVASDAPFDAGAWDRARDVGDDGGGLVEPIDEYLDGAQVLTDDFAPVDQLIVGVR